MKDFFVFTTLVLGSLLLIAGSLALQPAQVAFAAGINQQDTSCISPTDVVFNGHAGGCAGNDEYRGSWRDDFGGGSFSGLYEGTACNPTNSSFCSPNGSNSNNQTTYGCIATTSDAQSTDEPQAPEADGVDSGGYVSWTTYVQNYVGPEPMPSDDDVNDYSGCRGPGGCSFSDQTESDSGADEVSDTPGQCYDEMYEEVPLPMSTMATIGWTAVHLLASQL